jgi:hypothetical protein
MLQKIKICKWLQNDLVGICGIYCGPFSELARQQRAGKGNKKGY